MTNIITMIMSNVEAIIHAYNHVLHGVVKRVLFGGLCWPRPFANNNTTARNGRIYEQSDHCDYHELFIMS